MSFSLHSLPSEHHLEKSPCAPMWGTSPFLGGKQAALQALSSARLLALLKAILKTPRSPSHLFCSTGIPWIQAQPRSTFTFFNHIENILLGISNQHTFVNVCCKHRKRQQDNAWQGSAAQHCCWNEMAVEEAEISFWNSSEVDFRPFSGDCSLHSL